jgi:hypothetical protein
MVPEYGRCLHRWKCLLHDLKALHSELDLLKEQSGDISGRSREAADVTQCERVVINCNHHNWKVTGGCYSRFEDELGTGGNDDIDISADQLLHGFAEVFSLSLHIQELEGEILTFDISELSHTALERDPE